MKINMHLWAASCLALSSVFIGCSDDDDDNTTSDEAAAAAGESGSEAGAGGASTGDSAGEGGSDATASAGTGGNDAAASAGASGTSDSAGAGGSTSVSLNPLTCGSSTCQSLPAIASLGLPDGVQACCTEAGADNECGVVQGGSCVSLLANPPGCPQFTQSGGRATPCCLPNNVCGVDATAFGQGCVPLDTAKELLGALSVLLAGVEATTCDGQPVTGSEGAAGSGTAGAAGADASSAGAGGATAGTAG